MKVEWNEQYVSRLRAAAVAGVTRAAAAGALEASKGIALTSSPSTPGGFPGTQTGDLHRSMTFEAGKIDESGSAVARFGSNVVYARILALGGIIRAKKSKYLTIPVSREAKRASQQGKTARDIPGLVFRQKAGKSPVLGKVTGRGKSKGFKVWYVLKENVQIMPRPWHRLSITRGGKTISEAFKRGFSDHMSGGAA